MSENTEPTPAQDEAKEQEAVDWKAKSREWERRAKENKAAADELAALKDSQKSETEKLREQIAQLTKAQQEAATQAVRYRIAASHGISNDDADLFLTGADEDTITAQAKRLTERTSEQKRQGNYVPNEGRTPSNPADPNISFAKKLFGGDDS